MINNKTVQTVVSSFIDITEELEKLDIPQTQINKTIDEIISQGAVAWVTKAHSGTCLNDELKGKLYTSFGILNECRPFNVNLAVLRANEILNKVRLQLCSYGSIVDADQFVVTETESSCILIKDLEKSKTLVELICNFIYETENC